MSLTIGQVAQQAGIGIETVRFYERQGLIPEPPRTESGYRQYPERIVDPLRFIKRAQQLGFTLKEVAELLHLRVVPGMRCSDVKVRAQAKITEIEAKIKDLQRMQVALKKLAQACTGRGPTAECPILEALQLGQERTC
ncbi:MAG: MerR family DNA-binding transcriptional regulator [Acidobacteria bacterium]|nr:MerR family DNA-binding transcriptional regulator [Acidobacteriota bacterium]